MLIDSIKSFCVWFSLAVGVCLFIDATIFDKCVCEKNVLISGTVVEFRLQFTISAAMPLSSFYIENY